jgi:hypothetical protein
MASTSLREWFRLFAEVGETYRLKLMEPGWSRFDTDDPVDALRLFLESYAPERSRSNTDQYHAASDALLSFSDAKRPLRPSDVWEECVRRWSRFISESRGMGLHPDGVGLKINATDRRGRAWHPLFHDGRRCGSDVEGKRCLLCIVIREDGTLRNLVNDIVLADMSPDSDLAVSYRKLCSVFGVGDKVATFFLRDVADMKRRSFRSAKANRNLQPVDLWVERVYLRLRDGDTSYIKDWIAYRADDAGVDAKRVNQGMWYYGSHVAGSKFRFYQGMRNLVTATAQFAEHIRAGAVQSTD